MSTDRGQGGRTSLKDSRRFFDHGINRHESVINVTIIFPFLKKKTIDEFDKKFSQTKIFETKHNMEKV